MARTLILGGTRNLGHATALALIDAGHDVAVLNRGQTLDELPPEVERIRGDRSDIQSMRAALGKRTFDLVLDNTTYTESDAEQAVALFDGAAGHYVFISTGQVYLVRESLSRPFREPDYEGDIMAAPPRESADYSSWLYGIDKRLAEAIFANAAESGFPVTTLRLPMVASERDHYGRIQGYIARLLDNDPILIPSEKGLPLRHAYVNDVAQVVVRLIGTAPIPGRAFNISYGESMSLDQFLELLTSITGSRSRVTRVERARLDANGLLPDCSPFSGQWMSELDNSLSIAELGAEYTSPAEYLPSIVRDYRERWVARNLIPDSYRQRAAEVLFSRRS